MQDFFGRTAVITGGASGIGLGRARSFAGGGVQLVLADRDEARSQAVAREFLAGGTTG